MLHSWQVFSSVHANFYSNWLLFGFIPYLEWRKCHITSLRPFFYCHIMAHFGFIDLHPYSSSRHILPCLLLFMQSLQMFDSDLMMCDQVMPKQPGFDKRMDLYMLYHYLNHYNMFGSGYRSSAMSIIEDYLRMLNAWSYPPGLLVCMINLKPFLDAIFWFVILNRCIEKKAHSLHYLEKLLMEWR